MAAPDADPGGDRLISQGWCFPSDVIRDVNEATEQAEQAVTHASPGAAEPDDDDPEVVRLERDNAQYRALFEMQWRRMTAATARWRAEDPEARALIMPDLGDLLKWLMDDADKARSAPRCPAGERAADDPVSGLVLMLIDFDAAGNSVGRSWAVDDPAVTTHLRHLTTHLGPPMTDATNEELERIYERRKR